MEQQITFRGEYGELILTREQLQNIIGGQYANTLEGEKCFRVTPGIINRELFQEDTNNQEFEWYRCLILEAFHEWDTKQDKYLRSFDIYTSSGESSLTLFGTTYHKADWVELALAWAQFIANGASWQKLKNIYDDDHRIFFSSVIWKDGKEKHLGFSNAYHRYMINTTDYNPSKDQYRYARPLYVR